MTIIKAKFIKKHWFNIVKTNDGFAIVNTHRKQNMIDRDDIEKTIHFCKTIQEAEMHLEKYEKGTYAIQLINKIMKNCSKCNSEMKRTAPPARRKREGEAYQKPLSEYYTCMNEKCSEFYKNVKTEE